MFLFLYTLITVPASASADIFNMAGDLFTDLWVYLLIAIGVPLFFYIAKRVIGLVPKGR